MADITMPRLSDTMQEGTIAKWLKQPGDTVQKGDVVALIETDKATMDLTVYEAGTLQEILEQEGSTVAIGQPVARLGSGAGKDAKGTPATATPGADANPAATSAPSEDGSPSRTASAPPGAESTDSVKPASSEARAQATPVPDPSTRDAAGTIRAEAGMDAEPSSASVGSAGGASPAQPSAPSAGGRGEAAASGQPAAPRTERAKSRPDASPANGVADRVRASPLARRMAEEHGVDLGSLSGSGPEGRVIRADVEAALASGGAPSTAQPPSPQPSPAATAPQATGEDSEAVPLSGMRRTVARRMAESTRTVPHFFLTTTVDATELVKVRQALVEQNEAVPELGGAKVSLNDLVLKACAVALRQVPDINVSYAEDRMIRHNRVHIGFAVAVEGGLFVPVVRDTDRKSVSQISREARELATRAREGKLQPQEYSGGTFSVSNLGMFGVEHFNAVINPPEAAILAVGAVQREPAEHEGQIVLRDRMKLTLSVDHRASDGATGARFLQVVRKLLEQPLLLLTT